MANFRGSDWPSKTSEAILTESDQTATFWSILRSPPPGAPKRGPRRDPTRGPKRGPRKGPQIADTLCVLHQKGTPRRGPNRAGPRREAPGGAPGGPPQIADTLRVLHQEGTQRETAKSQILSVFCIQQGWEKTRVSVLSPYCGPLWRTGAARATHGRRTGGAGVDPLCDSFRN